ncbi:MAG: LytTR family DNA-binding domain-containing protein [Longicatena sp.]
MKKTYKISICDDDSVVSNNIRDLLENYFSNSKNDVLLSMYSNAEEFLDSNFDVDYLFLDIEMPGISGIELKEILQLENHKFGIIFVTSYKQYRDEAFGKNVLAYISKDKLERIDELLLKIEKSDSDFGVIKIASDVINIKDIFYLKADCGYVNIITNTKNYMFCGTLLELMNRIDNNHFVKIHRSYVVNLRYVENKSYDYVFLSRKYKLPLSRSHIDQFEQEYFTYLKEG